MMFSRNMVTHSSRSGLKRRNKDEPKEEFQLQKNYRVLNPTPTIMAFTEVTNAHGPSPQHSGLHRAVRQLQQEVTGPRQGLNLPCPRSKGWMGEQIRCQNFLVKRLQSRYTHPVIKCTLGSICKTS